MSDFYRIKLLTRSSGHPEEDRKFCFDNNLFAIGWPVDEDVKDIAQYKKSAEKKYCSGKELSGNINSSFNNMKNIEKDDFVWTQKDARTYCLGKVNSKIIFKSDYIRRFGLTCSCEKWKEINFDDVPGVVTSYFAGPGQVLVCCNSINENEDIKDYCNWLYNDKKTKIKISNYKKLLHYDDLEDLLGLFLQGSGYKGKRYYIHPSTNKLSTKLIEYELRGEDGEKIGIQCKIGNSTVNSNNLKELTEKGYKIFVSTNNNRICEGKNIENITVEELWTWAKNHQKILPDRIKNYISLC